MDAYDSEGEYDTQDSPEYDRRTQVRTCRVKMWLTFGDAASKHRPCPLKEDVARHPAEYRGSSRVERRSGCLSSAVSCWHRPACAGRVDAEAVGAVEGVA
jgi:hypothetical protein